MVGTLVPTRDHIIAQQSKNYWYSTNHQVVADADPRLVVAVGRPLPGNRNDCKAWELCGAKDAVGRNTVIADGGYRGTGLVIPHRRERGQAELPSWKEEHNASHRKVRSRVEHVFARMKAWKILRDWRPPWQRRPRPPSQRSRRGRSRSWPRRGLRWRLPPTCGPGFRRRWRRGWPRRRAGGSPLRLPGPRPQSLRRPRRSRRPGPRRRPPCWRRPVTSAASTRPTSVSSTERGVRTNRSAPTVCSSDLIARDRAGCVIASRCAARVKLRSRATARKYLICRRSMSVASAA